MKNNKTYIDDEIIEDILREYADMILNEGIKFDNELKVVSYDHNTENNVDTSLEHNPTVDRTIIPGIDVWSIFKRKRGEHGDGNPLVYALKGENGWKFRSRKDQRDVERQFDAIANKFAKLYPIGVTIVLPSSNMLNTYIASVVMSKSKDAELIKGAIRKMTTVEVENIVLEFDSKFREYYKGKFNDAFDRLCDYLERMDDKYDGMFTRHLIDDKRMREVLDFTLKASEDRYARFASKITGQNILIIDDTISRGQTIKEACKIMTETYAPKSITVLTLLSKLYDE